jgi:hypothetical protein
MIQQVTITTESAESIKPLVESAIYGKLKNLQYGINRTRERLDAFEQQFGMTSAEFERRINARELEESLDFIEWLGEIETLRILEEQQRSLQSAQVR